MRVRTVALTVVLLAGVVTGQARADAAVAVVDLGTLPGGTWSEAVDVNEAGVVVGRSDAADGRVHAVRWDPRGAVADLGTVGGERGAAVAVNDHGEVAGTIVVGGQQHAARWNARGEGVDLGTLPDGGESWGVAISGDGSVVGNGYAREGSNLVIHALRWDRTGRIVDLGATSRSSYVYGVNDVGFIAGVAYTPDYDTHAAKWDPHGNLTILEDLPDTVYSEAYSVNDAGVVTGHVDYAGNGEDHAVRWDRHGRMTDLGTLPGGTYSTAGVTNILGTTVGVSTLTPELSPMHAVRWDRQGRITDLGTLPGASTSSAVTINRNGTIIGYSGLAGVWWDKRGRIGRLPDLDDGPTRPLRINDDGLAVGSSGLGNTHHAVLWRLPR